MLQQKKRIGGKQLIIPHLYNKKNNQKKTQHIQNNRACQAK